MTPTRLPALLLDFDGVLRQWPADDASNELDHGLPVGSIVRTARGVPAFQDALLGVVTDAQWRAQTAAALQQEFPDAPAAAAVQAWTNGIGVIDTRVLDVAREWRARGAVLALLSNATFRLHADLAAHGLTAVFDLVVSSSGLGIAKPDQGFFQHALQALGITAADALYVDDSAQNVHAAEEIGIRSWQFTSADAMRAWLSDQDAAVTDQ